MKSSLPSEQRWVPVVSSTGLPLMPCSPVRARKLVQRGRAVKRWKNRLFYIQLLDIETGVTQPTVLGIDPGSKMEGYTVNTDPLSVKLERRQARRNQALLRSSLRGRNLLPVLKDGVSGSLRQR